MKCVNCLQVSPKTVSLQRGKWYYGMSVQVFPSDADCRCATWHSENPQVASVNASSGYIYAQSAGTVRIYATATDGSGCRDFVTVTVKDSIPVESVTLNRTSLTLEKGKTATLGVTICPTNATNRNVNWTSSNNGVATVNNGIITAVSNGSARITATAADGSGKSANCTITVTGDTLVTSISVSPNCSTMTAGSMRVFRATVYPSGATNKGVTWSSSNETIATVNPNSGMVTAKKAGSVQIRATACDRGGVYGIACLQVCKLPDLESLSLSLKRKTLSENESIIVSAIVIPHNADTTGLVWTSSNSAVATVDVRTGVVRAKKEGTATITATCGDFSDACFITVDYRDKVVVEKNPDNKHSRIVFPNGKIWNCINFDVVNGYHLDTSELESQRFYENVYQNKTYDDVTLQYYYDKPLKEYTQDEIRVIYTIDPHGLCGYVQEYAKEVAKTESSTAAMYQKLLGTKDEIFYTLFRRRPKYYARDIRGTWYETSDRSNLAKVISESECLFGYHPVYDINTLLSFVTVALDMISMAIQCPAVAGLKGVSGLGKAIKYYSMATSIGFSIINSDFNGFVSAIINGTIDEDKLNENLVIPAQYKSQNYTLG